MDQANNVSQFLGILERYNQYSNIYYRGQSSKYSTITSSISRDKGYLENEYAIFAESIKMKEDEFKYLTYPFERLSKLQHFGFPTRLIDISINPLVALFFAVQDTESDSDGTVYVYIQNGKSIDSKHVRLLALLATLEKYDLETIINSYQQIYSETISGEEIFTMAPVTTFIEYSAALKESNSRLFNQEGTFALCGNEVVGKNIQRKLQSLNSIKATHVIRIPYEYKSYVKRELDEKFSINEAFIYPELPSVATYIKEKYKHKNFSFDGTYSIVQTRDISHALAKRISIVIVLSKPLSIERIKQVSKLEISNHQDAYDVIWLYVARNGEDYIMTNWILQGQWISPSLDEKYRPIIIGEQDDDGYSWKEGEAYSVRSDFNSKHVFEDNKVLYISYRNIYKTVRPIYKRLVTSLKSKNFNEFVVEVNLLKDVLRKFFLELGNFGHSRDKNFDDYLANYKFAISLLDDIILWIQRDDLNISIQRSQIELLLRDASKYFQIIERDRLMWESQLNVTQEDYDLAKSHSKPKPLFQYEQTIPVSENALNVDFDVKIMVNPDNTFNISGKTNLFDHANLVVSIYKKDGTLCGQDSSSVVDGKFRFGAFSDNISGYKQGNYEAEITLSIPNVQPKQFVAKAGVEYENLTGPYMDRTGIGPTLSYKKEFEI